jgi:excisionase family DNA binding protein
MATPDYSTWLTKQQSADALGCSTKTVEQFAKDRKIEQAAWRPQGRGAERAVYNPDDVTRIAATRQPARPAFVLPALQAQPTNGNGHHAQLGALARAQPSAAGPEAARSFLEAMLTAILAQSSQTSEKSQNPTTFLTVAEAAAVTGLTQAYLRRAIAAKTLPAIRDRGWRIRRKDLEQL